jgi:hypothetical protein
MKYLNDLIIHAKASCKYIKEGQHLPSVREQMYRTIELIEEQLKVYEKANKRKD